MSQSTVSGGQKLDRQMGFVALLASTLTGMIGSGWLFASLFAAQIAGPAAIISWIIGGTIAIVIALVYAELGAMLPVAGGIARVPFFSHGTLSGFMAGWLVWLAYVTTAPIEVTAVLEYSSNYLPELVMNEHGERVLSPVGLAAAMVMMLVFTFVNLLGVKWLANANITITAWKLSLPFIAPAILIAVGFHSENFFDMGGFAPAGMAGVFGAVSTGGVMFSLFGFRTAVDLAGEAKNPQRNVPLALIAAILISVGMYMLLQVAFIGVVPASHLAGGWSNLSESVPGGPFAAFALLLGMPWLALLLYGDAILSPSGTGLSYVGTTARINYAMAQDGLAPKFFQKLNRFKVPAWSIAANFVFGMVIFLPFPGWSALVGFISSTVVLSFAFGPVALVALRYQKPDLARPFKLPIGVIFSALVFVVIGFVVYWTGWDTNWRVFLVATGGIVLLALTRMTTKTVKEPLHISSSLWIWPYFAGLALISYLGNFGNGRGFLPAGYDLLAITVFSLGIFWLAIKLRLPDSDAQRFVATAD